ncbi:Molybdopterin or thiamine biosynthesis adenylyltransferase [Poseidonocella pacifica]|uniref:Molybdopterin-synthase adenylyltransferase n=1 Tax=Poseidonocella pacifica TaxID=871651 RepID=A0A1I0Z1W3_9RHOB|nr:molybdopterin-synthase adenylyltransferase MoeB [Poseidonocella pacifica]SFB18418.1 Molybdopterin or thiamine biosynthesis adenylyltransferase [Poseidonocella pacifica]
MLFVLALGAAIWGLGHLMGASRRQRWLLLLLLYIMVVLVNLTLPEGASLRQATGGSAAGWLILGGFAAMVWGYRALLSRIRNRARPASVPQTPKGTFSETELERYARHIVLREVGGPGQKALKHARVLVLGAGGLGAPALQYLAAAGIGTIGIVDDDEVELSNLHRQVIHTDARTGMPKVFSAEVALRALNPHIDVLPYHRRFDDSVARDLVADFDVILDGTDNFDTRYLANRVAAELGKPLISGALSQWEGQLSVFDPAQGGPCYECIFPTRPAPGLAPSCAEAGVVGTLPGVVGAMMANEAIKLITGAGASLRGDMLIYDALYGETRKVHLHRRDDCPVCGAGTVPRQHIA